MFDRLLNTTSNTLLKQSAIFAERRQDVLAGNIANLDTPGYRMRDLPVSDFQAALKHAADVLDQPPTPAGSLHPVAGNSLALQYPNPVPGNPMPTEQQLFPQTLFTGQVTGTQPGMTFQDGNNRSIEQQMLTMTKNSMLQSVATQLLNLQYNQLQSVISEQVR